MNHGAMVVALGLFVAPLAVPPCEAATEKVLWSFDHQKVGYSEARLRFLNGTLVGTASGLAYGPGQVFQVTESGGTWSGHTRLKFDKADGAKPVAGLALAPGGYLFGTTSKGDAYNAGNLFVLYKVGGSWIHGTVWAFGGTKSDGQSPEGDLVLDSSGNVFGTAREGGSLGWGTVFELTETFGSWSETVLHNFAGGSDGGVPQAGLIVDKTGAFYGTTMAGGTGACLNVGCGTVFKLAQSGGTWTEENLYSFQGGSDGSFPLGALVEGSKGHLFGTTWVGGSSACGGCGVVFEVYQSGGAWKERLIHVFSGGADGSFPASGLLLKAGVLYGVTQGGGTNDAGTAFSLHESGGTWTEVILHNFGNAGDGVQPVSQLIMDKSGNFYGTTQSGGTSNYGTVYEITP